MRQHGFPRFPDPNSQGQLTPAMLSASGIDLEQPAIKPAAYGCLRLTHGIISRADVNQAISNPNGSGSQHSSAAACEQNQVVAGAGVGRVVEPVLLMAAVTEVAERDSVGRVAEAQVRPARPGGP